MIGFYGIILSIHMLAVKWVAFTATHVVANMYALRIIDYEVYNLRKRIDPLKKNKKRFN